MSRWNSLVRVRQFLLWLLLSITSGAAISSLMETTDWFSGIVASSVFFSLSIGILYFLYRFAGSGKTLAWLIAVAFILRLVVGVTLMKALPVVGYPTDQQKAGYVFYDAFRRDTQAASLATSDKPILSTFTQRYSTDQYGGYLASSMFIYRYLSPEVHRPQLMLILSALAGAAAVPFFWLVTKRIWSESFAKLAGWIFVLFPQSVLMGASQMRESWLILFLTMAFWSIVEWKKANSRKPLLVLGISLVGFLFISPGMILLTVIFLAGWMMLERRQKPIPIWAYLVGVGVALAGIFVFAYGLSSPQQFAKNSPLEIIFKWFKNAIAWDVYLSTEGSGRLEFLFKSLPGILQFPFVIIYGVLQPVLPAAILDKALWIWNVISSILAAGWYLLLPLLVYTPFAIRGEKDARLRNQLIWMTIVSWVWILICSARAGGDQWDNPRYRVIVIPWLAILATWAWEWAKEHRFVWLKRIGLIEGVFLVFFAQWYASRYYQLFGRLDLRLMLGIIGVISLCIIGIGWVSDRSRQRSTLR